MEGKILKHLVNNYITKKFRNPQKQRKFLIDCIRSSGYINSENSESDVSSENSENEFEDLYEHMIKQKENGNDRQENYQDFQSSYQEQQHSSVDPYNFNRTFITLSLENGGDRLAELQKRGISYEETKFDKVKEEMETIIKGINSDENGELLKTALNIYINIMIYYNTNPFNLMQMKGSLKRGYILMSVYYSFIYNNQFVDKEKLLTGNIRLKDLPNAEANMKMIFKGKFDNFDQKSHTNFRNFVNFKKFLKFLKYPINIDNKKLLKTIDNVIEETTEIVPSTKLGLYSIIYFVCNNYFPFKVKIILNDSQTFITYPLLNEEIGAFSSPTVRKITDKLVKFYKKS